MVIEEAQAQERMKVSSLKSKQKDSVSSHNGQ